MFFSLLAIEGTGGDVAQEPISVPSVIMQYIFYGAIFIIGLIVLGIMNRGSKKPVAVRAFAKTETVIKNIDKLLLQLQKNKKSVYAISPKIMQLKSEIGDLVVLADNEYTTNKNISFEGVLSYYQTAFECLGDYITTRDANAVERSLNDAKAQLNGALELLKRITRK